MTGAGNPVNTGERASAAGDDGFRSPECWEVDWISFGIDSPLSPQEPLAEICRGLRARWAQGRPGERERGQGIFVADDDNVARAYATDLDSPAVTTTARSMPGSPAAAATTCSRLGREQSDSEVTFDQVCDELIIYGTPNNVADQLLVFREHVGDFGTLLYAGKDWKDRDLGRRSMILLAEKVLPQINAAIGADKAVA